MSINKSDSQKHAALKTRRDELLPIQVPKQLRDRAPGPDMAPRLFQSGPVEGVQFDNVLSLCEKTSTEKNSSHSKKASSSRIQCKESAAQVFPSELAHETTAPNEYGDQLLEISKLLGECFSLCDISISRLMVRVCPRTSTMRVCMKNLITV